MHSHTIPYFGDVAFRPRDYLLVAGTIAYFLFSLLAGFASGWDGSVLLGIALSILASLILMMAASKRSVSMNTGEYRFGDSEE